MAQEFVHTRSTFLHLKIRRVRLLLSHWQHTILQFRCNVLASRVTCISLWPICYLECLCDRLRVLMCSISQQLIDFSTTHCFTKPLVTKPYCCYQHFPAHAFKRGTLLSNVSFERTRRVCSRSSNKPLLNSFTSRCVVCFEGIRTSQNPRLTLLRHFLYDLCRMHVSTVNCLSVNTVPYLHYLRLLRAACVKGRPWSVVSLCRALVDVRRANCLSQTVTLSPLS